VFSASRRASQPFCADAKAVLVEMQHYGLILADNGSNWYFGGAAYPHAIQVRPAPGQAARSADQGVLINR
jgi:hypothetical protein